jgi:hypothetical protein
MTKPVIHIQRSEICIKIMLGNPEGKKHFENLIVDGNIYHIKTVTKGTG